MNNTPTTLTRQLILGPCSAESREQLFTTAEALKDLPISYFRAGIWKPRTRPGHFEGYGQEALTWLLEVKKAYNLPIAIEVASQQHMEAALNAGVDMVWIGARTTPNPFTINLLANMTRGTSVAVYVKNPVNADLNLWLGALERFDAAGVKQLAAIHRGFTSPQEKRLRNAPLWDIPLALKNQWPDLPILHDPSHIAGNKRWLPGLLAEAKRLPFSGLMLEVHPDPENALTDSNQQVRPAFCKKLIDRVSQSATCNSSSLQQLANLRQEIDSLDSLLLKTLQDRFERVSRIGELKQTTNMQVYQPNRWQELMKHRRSLGETFHLSESFVAALFECIHQESITQQSTLHEAVQ
jgi:chorismate mutase